MPRKSNKKQEEENGQEVEEVQPANNRRKSEKKNKPNEDGGLGNRPENPAYDAKAERAKRPKLDTARLAPGEWCSSVIYNKVKRVDEHYVHVDNQYGLGYMVEKSLMEGESWSASQFDQEKKVTRTELCEILENAADTVFTVHFKTKATEARAKELLGGLTAADLQDAKKMRGIAKDIIEGQETTIVGKLNNTEPKMGRSSVTDLNAPQGNNYRLVDHRNIQWIITKNVKYSAK